MKPKFVFAIAFLFGTLLTASDATAQVTEKKLRQNEIVFGEAGEVTSRRLFGRRDIGKYSQGGHYDFRRYRIGEARKGGSLTDLADFLVQSLSNKSLAYARASYNSPDAGGTYHFFIEPDRQGQWSVTAKLVGWHALPLGGNRLVVFPKMFRVEQTVSDSKVLEISFFDRAGKLGLRIRSS